MTNRKNYNSLVFLTTLSVYLGLVLVGGSAPSVLAQAATTRDFNIKNETVVEDDLDKKPDDELHPASKNAADKNGNQFVAQYAETILALLENPYSPESLADNELVNTNFLTFRKDWVADDFGFKLDKDKLFGKLNLKPRFSGDFSPAGYSDISSLDLLRSETPNQPETAALKHTRIAFENNQVFIVTRLPRASIDALLADTRAR